MSKKLRKILDDIAKAEEKLAMWQAHLDELHTRRKQIEDAEIVKSVRAMKLEGREMLAFLEGLQSGTVPVRQEQSGIDAGQTDGAAEKKEDGTMAEDGVDKTENNNRPDETPAEREEIENEEKD